MFQIEGREELWAWLDSEPDSQRRLGMLEWLAEFAADPLRDAWRVPGIRAPVFIVKVPLVPLPVLLKFLYVDQYRVIRIIEFSPLP